MFLSAATPSISTKLKMPVWMPLATMMRENLFLTDASPSITPKHTMPVRMPLVPMMCEIFVCTMMREIFACTKADLQELLGEVVVGNSERGDASFVAIAGQGIGETQLDFMMLK